MIITLETEVEVDLVDIPTEDLLDELESRTDAPKPSMDYDAYSIIRVLEKMNCPTHIIQQLDNWNREPIPNLNMLERWIGMRQF